MPRIVLPKGSLQEQTLLLFTEADLPVRRSAREYTVTIADERISAVKILRPQEIPKHVEEGYFRPGHLLDGLHHRVGRRCGRSG